RTPTPALRNPQRYQWKGAGATKLVNGHPAFHFSLTPHPYCGFKRLSQAPYSSVILGIAFPRTFKSFPIHHISSTAPRQINRNSAGKGSSGEELDAERTVGRPLQGTQSFTSGAGGAERIDCICGPSRASHYGFGEWRDGRVDRPGIHPLQASRRPRLRQP